MKYTGLAAAFCAALTLSACIGPTQSRMGMVVDEQTGIMYGSTIEKNILTDASFYSNRRIKVRTRNTSGDLAFGLSDFSNQLKTAYSAKGFEPTTADDFGVLVDVNVMYSVQAQTNTAMRYSWQGASGGSRVSWHMGQFFDARSAGFLNQECPHYK